MPPTLLVGTVALALVSPTDSTRSAGKPVVRPVSFSADSIVVEKSAHRLVLYREGALVRTYLVALGQQPVGDKVRKGDMRTPEGLFRIEARNPQSRYHLALRISYPGAAQRARARALGVSPGGDIMIHGLPKAAGVRRSRAPRLRLDRGMHRRHERGDRGDLECRPGGHSDPHQAVTALPDEATLA